MEHAALVEALRREGAALGAVPISDIDVPTCPEWTLPELIRHVGHVHRWQEAQLRAQNPDQLEPFDRSGAPDDDEALVDWYHDGLMSLLGALDATPADHLCPSWFGPRSATFWARRAAHETAVHRWDAEAAVDRADPIQPEQAVDLLDELFEVMAPRRFDTDGWSGPEVSLHLHATDVDGEWIVHLGAGGLRVDHAHEKGDLAARGTASDLALLMAGRLPPARLELFGEARVLDRWFQSVKL